MEGLTVGWFGQLHPREAAARKLKEAVFVGELWLDRLYALPPAKPVVRELSTSMRLPFHVVQIASNGRRSMQHLPERLYPRWSTGGCGKSVANPGPPNRVHPKTAPIRCCSASPFRPLTGRCAMRSCSVFRWLLSKRLRLSGRVCGVDQFSAIGGLILAQGAVRRGEAASLARRRK